MEEKMKIQVKMLSLLGQFLLDALKLVLTTVRFEHVLIPLKYRSHRKKMASCLTLILF